MLVRLDEPVSERFWYEVELDELSDAGKHLMVLLGAAVQPQHNRRDVAEYSRTHQRYKITQSSRTTHIRAM